MCVSLSSIHNVRDLNARIFNSLMYSVFFSQNILLLLPDPVVQPICYAVFFNTRPFSWLIYDGDYVLNRWGLTFYSRVLTWNSVTSWNASGKKKRCRISTDTLEFMLKKLVESIMDTEQVMSTNAWEAAVIYQPFGCQDPDMLFDDFLLYK